MSESAKGEHSAIFLKKQYSFNQQHNFWVNPNAVPFSYSDGEAIEQQLLEIVQHANDISITSNELRQQAQESWPLTYHLHARRANLLRPVQHLLTGKILEIGAGCGAITRFLGESGGEILAIEGSERRAVVAAARCRDLPNVTVVVDQFHQVPIIPEYDAVTLIGVLEYARLYFPAEAGVDPVDALLTRARQFLKPQGVLILAIENQLGLKYFAGYGEDHTGQLMQGIEDRYAMNGVVTFGRVELAQRLKSSGFAEQRWWFPFPDYKMPTLLLTEHLLIHDTAIDIAPILSSALAADAQSPRQEGFIFSLEQASRLISRNKLFGELANSFLVIASAQLLDKPKDIIGYHYASDRRAKFNKVITFFDLNGQIRVTSKYLYPQVAATHDLPLAIKLSDNGEFIDGEHWQQKLYDIVNQPGWTLEELTAWAKVWLDFFLLYAEVSTCPTATTLVPGRLLDALPRNLIIKRNGLPVFIDQEWLLRQPIELGYVVFRAVFLSLSGLRSVAQPESIVPVRLIDLFLQVAHCLDITIMDIDIQRYQSFDSKLMYWVNGTIASQSDIVDERILPVRWIVNQERTQFFKSSATLTVLEEEKVICIPKTESLYRQIIMLLNSRSWSYHNPLYWITNLVRKIKFMVM
jgi:2-polyprenyl-3-methyl-5-hydroxy-6-metoxy-1,4-benzoquinol methylase